MRCELIDVPYGKLFLPEGDHITNIVKSSGDFYESDLLHAIAIGYWGGVFYDVGAHCGNHTLFFATACKADTVVAIEPDKDSFSLLVRMVEGNGLKNVIPIFAAVELEPGCKWVDTYMPPGNASGLNTGSHKTWVGETAPCLRLETLMRHLPPTVIKVDIEASSAVALRTCKDQIMDFRPLIVAEAEAQEDVAAVDNLLLPLGYWRSKRYCRTPTYIWESTWEDPASC